MGERELRMGEWNDRSQWNMEVGRRRQTFENRAIYFDVLLTVHLSMILLINQLNARNFVL